MISEGYLDKKVERVFVNWEKLLAHVRTSPLAHLAEDVKPVFVYVFASPYACKYYLRKSRGLNVDGCYIPQTQQVYASSGTLGRPERYLQVLRHELTHHLHWSTRESTPPRWLSEGLAERFESDQGGYAPPNLTPDILGLFAWTHKHLLDPVEQRARYGHARALVRAILDEPGASERFAKIVREPKPAETVDALCEALEISPSRLRLIYARELRRGDKLRQSRRPAARPSTTTPVTASPAVDPESVWLTVGILALIGVPIAACVVVLKQGR